MHRIMWSGIGELGHFDVVRNSRRWAQDLGVPKRWALDRWAQDKWPGGGGHMIKSSGRGGHRIAGQE